jgi:hypothetical protein
MPHLDHKYSIGYNEGVAWSEIDKINEMFVGRKIVKADQKDSFTIHLTLDNGQVVQVQGNLGEVVPGEGWYQIASIAEALPGGRIMGVSSESDEWEEHFTLFVMTEGDKMPLVEFEGSDNGYYGTGFWLQVL